MQLQLGRELVDLSALDEIEARLQVRQQLLGDGLARVGQADVAARLERGDADAVAALLQGERILVDLLTHLQRVPSFRRILQGGDGVFEVVRITAQLGGFLAQLVVAIKRRADFVELLAQAGVVARRQRLLKRQSRGAEILLAQGRFALAAEAVMPCARVFPLLHRLQCVRLHLQSDELGRGIAVAEFPERGLRELCGLGALALFQDGLDFVRGFLSGRFLVDAPFQLGDFGANELGVAKSLSGLHRLQSLGGLALGELIESLGDSGIVIRLERRVACILFCFLGRRQITRFAILRQQVVRAGLPHRPIRKDECLRPSGRALGLLRDRLRGRYARRGDLRLPRVRALWRLLPTTNERDAEYDAADQANQGHALHGIVSGDCERRERAAS